MPHNPNVMGYPFLSNTRAVSSFFLLIFLSLSFFLSAQFLFLLLSLTLLSSDCSPLSKSMRSLWLAKNIELEVTSYLRELYGPRGAAYPSSGGGDDDNDNDGGEEEDSEATPSY